MPDTTRESKNYVNRRERISGAIYVLLFFALGTALGSVALLSSSDRGQVFSRKNHVSAQMKRQQQFRWKQGQTLTICKRLEERIIAYDPGINAVYEKKDILLMIDELRQEYKQNRLDRRYMVYRQLESCYQMWFDDRQHLQSLRSNISYLKQNLEECELGLSRKKEKLRNR